MTASNGLATPPCGVPRLLPLPPLMRRLPSSSRASTGACSHSLISHSTCRSTIRRATDLSRSACGIVSKYFDRSASITSVAPEELPVHFLDRIDRATARSIAVSTVLEVRLEDRLQHHLRGSLRHPSR